MRWFCQDTNTVRGRQRKRKRNKFNAKPIQRQNPLRPRLSWLKFSSTEQVQRARDLSALFNGAHKVSLVELNFVPGIVVAMILFNALHFNRRRVTRFRQTLYVTIVSNSKMNRQFRLHRFACEWKKRMRVSERMRGNRRMRANELNWGKESDWKRGFERTRAIERVRAIKRAKTTERPRENVSIKFGCSWKFWDALGLFLWHSYWRRFKLI